MRFKAKQIRIIVFAAFCFGLIILAFYGPAQPKLIVPLADGSRFELTGTDSGRKLYFGGGRWQKIACEALGHQLPAFVHGQPMICAALYTNGIGLLFRREEPDRSSLQKPWNGSGQLFYLDESNVEHRAPSHCVNFQTETRGQSAAIVGEEIYWEIPMLRNAELRLRLRETNELTGVVSIHNFQIKNPSL